MSNLNWKTIGIMAGVATVVSVLAIAANQAVVSPMLEKSKQASRKNKSKQAAPTA